MGAHINGPNAKPRTYRVVPSAPTSDPTPNSLLALFAAGAKMALVKDTMKVPLHTRIEVKSLIHISLAIVVSSVQTTSNG
jgi:hypothetical protein